MQYAKGKFKNIYAIRLESGEDLMAELRKACDEYGIKHGTIISGLGSLVNVHYFDPKPMPDNPGKYHYGDPMVLEGVIELISLSGMICDDEGEVSLHVHGAFADRNGKCYAGHIEGNNLVFATVEIMIGEVEGVFMARSYDDKFGVKLFSPRQL